MSKRQSSLMFFVSLIISGTIFIQMVLYVIAMLAGWNIKFNLVEVCHSTLKSIGLSSLEYVLDALVIYTLLSSFWKMGSQLVHASRMKRRFQQYREKMLTIKMNETYKSGKRDLIVISYPGPIAITMGFIRPKIVISTGLINLLNEEELKAVVSHEKYHKENRDPLKIFLLSLFASTMGSIEVRGADFDPPTNLSQAGQSGIAVGAITPDRNNAEACWFWFVADNLRLAAENAVAVARQLL